MIDRTRSIGATARASGLSVSALRFYDQRGVLRPAHVDPYTGYRRYSSDQIEQARLIAALRRVGMSLPQIGDILDARHDPVVADRRLDRYLARLEDGLADARRELGAARTLIHRMEPAMTTMTVRGADLLDAYVAVGYAVSRDPELPALNGVLFDYDGTVLRLVASDRYRLAVSTVPVSNPDGPAVGVIVPVSVLADSDLQSQADVPIRLEPDSVQVNDVTSPAVDAVFPDYRRFRPAASAKSVSLTATELRRRVSDGPTRTMIQEPNNVPHEISVLRLVEDTLDVIDGDHPDAVGLNREFLLEAIDAGVAEQLVLALDGPIAPLAIRYPDRPDDFSLLMSTRLN